MIGILYMRFLLISHEINVFSHFIIIMTHPSKRKTKVKEQERNKDRKFAKKPRIVKEIDNWKDKDNNGWDDKINFLNEKENKCELIWSDNAHLEQKKHGPKN